MPIRRTAASPLARAPFRAAAMAFRASRNQFLLSIALQLVAAVVLVVQLFATRRVLADLVAGARVSQLIPSLGLLVAALVVIGLTSAARGPSQQLLAEHVQRFALRRVLAVAARAELLAFEGPAFNNRVQRAMVNAGVSTVALTSGLTSIMASLSGTVAIGVALAVVEPWLLLGLVVGAVPTYVAGRAASRALYQFGVAETEADRERLVLQLLVTDRNHAKEIRAYGLSERLNERWDANYDGRLARLTSVMKRRVAVLSLAALLSAVITSCLVAFLVFEVSEGRLSLADAGTSVLAFLILAGQVQGLVAGTTALLQNSLFLSEFEQLEAVFATDNAFAGSEQLPGSFLGLRVDGVGFTYPSSERPALSDVSLEIRPGEVVALVGENGSGKSTLAKIIAGLFPATSGVVSMSGVNYADADIDRVRDNLAVLFQDFVKYQMTVRSNVTAGRWSASDDEERLSRAVDLGGSSRLVAALPHGLDTMLGPNFTGGSELSGGQWQRLATSRSLFREAPLIILDEPTAALDPHAEADLFNRTRSIFRGKSVLLISHRFASVRLADRIYVLNDGKVAEVGTHDELLRHGGLYESMFRTQQRGLLGEDEVL